MSDSTRPDRLSLTVTDPPTPEEEHRARLAVAHHAENANECRELLQMLGLIDPGFRWETTDHHRGVNGRRKITKESA